MSKPDKNRRQHASSQDDHQTSQGGTVAGEAEMGAQNSRNGGSGAGVGSVSQVSEAESGLADRIDELTGDLQRLQAEFTNYKRREEATRADTLAMAKRQVVMQLLPILDNIDRALAHRPDELKDNSWAGGVEQVGRQAADTLKKLGVEKIVSVGQPFDHNLHEAISMEDGEGDDEVVTEELQPGYRMGEVVIRHAMVKVGRK